MASLILDLTLTRWDSFEPTEPDTPERTIILSQILAAAGCEGWVDVWVLQENGPAGGNPEVEFTGARADIERLGKWSCEESGEDWESWAREYWTDRD